MPKSHATHAPDAWNLFDVTDRKAPQAAKLGILPDLLGYHLRRAHVAVFQDFARAMAGLDVTPGQVGVLQVIAANPGLSQTALGRALGIDRSTVVAVIDRLEGRGLVVRALSPNDRRSHALRLSAAGEKALGEIERRVRAHEKRIARALDPAERAQLIRLLTKLES
jgi:DNA-binding MarR family transcriptional regulator